MSSSVTPPERTADLALDGVLSRVLSRLDDVATPVNKLRGKNETKVLRDLNDGLKRARILTRAARNHITAGAYADAAEAVLDLVETVREGIGRRDNIDEIEREWTDASAEGVPPSRQRWWSEIERGVDDMVALAGDLIEYLKSYSHAHDSKGAPTMDETDSTAEAVRDLGITIATMIGGTPPTGASRAARRYEAVADQMTATLDMLGLPHDGVQLSGSEADAAARARLIDGLTRNFASKERAGFKIYSRTATPLAGRDPSSPTDLLRGSALVNANLLRAEADAVLGIIDRLPSMVRFQLVQPYVGGAFEAQATIRGELNAIVESARDPMGINRLRVTFQFSRLVLAILDYLDQAEIFPRAGKSYKRDGQGIDLIMAWLSTFRDDEVCIESSVVRDEEVRAELANLIDVLLAIGRRLIADRPDEARGQAAARVEECLTSAFAAADAVELTLERSGTDLYEQDIQFASSDCPAVRISIGQFIRWVRATAGPFARAENRAASLRQPQVALLFEELDTLAAIAGALGGELATFGLRRSTPRQQLAELESYLKTAADEAKRLGGAAIAG